MILVSNVFEENGQLKSWHKLFNYFNLTKELYFKPFQITHAILKSRKLVLLNDQGNCQNIIYLNHDLIKNHQVLAIEKCIPKELFSLSLSLLWKVTFLCGKNIWSPFSPSCRLSRKIFPRSTQNLNWHEFEHLAM